VSAAVNLTPTDPRPSPVREHVGLLVVAAGRMSHLLNPDHSSPHGSGNAGTLPAPEACTEEATASHVLPSVLSAHGA
jgi:hypothetical protein